MLFRFGWVSFLGLIRGGPRICQNTKPLEIELLTAKPLEGASGLRPERCSFHRVNIMTDIIKMVVFVIVVLALSPLAGFWIVALVGAALFLLPVCATVSGLFPKLWKHIEDSLFSRVHFLHTA